MTLPKVKLWLILRPSVHPHAAYENFVLGLEGFFASFVFHRAADLNSSDAPVKWFAIFQTNYHLESGDR